MFDIILITVGCFFVVALPYVIFTMIEDWRRNNNE